MFYLALNNSTLLLYDQLEENEIRNMILLIQTIETTGKRDNVNGVWHSIHIRFLCSAKLIDMIYSLKFQVIYMFYFAIDEKWVFDFLMTFPFCSYFPGGRFNKTIWFFFKNQLFSLKSHCFYSKWYIHNNTILINHFIFRVYGQNTVR